MSTISELPMPVSVQAVCLDKVRSKVVTDPNLQTEHIATAFSYVRIVFIK
jgi:hypothetical protein